MTSNTVAQKKPATANAPAPPKAGAAKMPQLRLERVFDATPERLWTYWTDPKKYARWLSPQKADLVIHEWDLRVGGRVKFDMPLDNGQVNHEEGFFHVLDKPRLLVTGNAEKTFVITATFEPVGTKQTRLKVVVEGVPAEWHNPATIGWNTGFDKLERLIGGEGAPPAVMKASGPTSPSPSSRKKHIGVERATGRVTKDRYVEVERWFAAPAAKVFGAWGDAKLLPSFFWPVGTGRVEKLEFRPGGELRMAHTTQDWTAIWKFMEIVPAKRIVIRDIWPDGSGNEATGTLEFLPENGGTRLKVRHGPFPTTGPYQPEGAVAGFSMGMERLAETVEVPGPGEGFQLVRYFNAPAKKVWDMWTTKEGLGKWWALSAKDMGYAFKVNKLDVRVGGQYDIQMSNKEHGELHNHGTYTEVVPGRRLAMRWDFDIFLAPGEKAYPIDIVIEFEEVPGMDPEGPKATKMTFTQGPMAKPDYTEGSRQGVISNFAKLSKALDG